MALLSAIKKKIYISGTVNNAFQRYKKNVLLNYFYGILSVALFSLSKLVYPFGQKRSLFFVFIRIFIRGAYA